MVVFIEHPTINIRFLFNTLLRLHWWKMLMFFISLLGDVGHLVFFYVSVIDIVIAVRSPELG